MRRKLVLAVGVLALVAAGAVRWYGAPALIRFPLNVNETAHYTGTATIYVDAKSGALLAQPLHEPVAIDRNVRVIKGGYSHATVEETDTVDIGGQVTHQVYRFVMDRRSMKLVGGSGQYAFGDPANVMHDTGSYRVNWPLGTSSSGQYLSFIVETDTAVPLTLVRGKHYHPEAGISVLDFSSKQTAPVAPYYQSDLKAQGLPMELSAEQLQPQLLAQGIDVAKALADVGPLLTPSEAQTVASVLSTPVPLKYIWVMDGTVSLEPRTGSLMDVHANTEGVAVEPDLSGASGLQALLQKYSSIPSVKAAADGLTRLASAPPTLAENLVYTQTAASSRHFGNEAKQQIRQMDLIQRWIPLGLATLGGLLLLVTAAGYGYRRRRAGTPPGESQPSPPGREAESAQPPAEPLVNA